MTPLGPLQVSNVKNLPFVQMSDERRQSHVSSLFQWDGVVNQDGVGNSRSIFLFFKESRE